MNKKTKALTTEQYKEIIQTMREGFSGCRPNERIATALVLEGNLGLRISDILKLRLCDIARDGDRYRLEIVEQKTGVFFPITIGRTLHSNGNDYIMRQYTAVYAEQANVLREMAEKSDCVIVGRCGDYILKDYHPFRIFVYSDMDAKMRRCREKADEHEHLSDKELRRLIHRIDKNRARYYHYYSGQIWGKHSNYDMCVNTSAIPVKELATALTHLFEG